MYKQRVFCFSDLRSERGVFKQADRDYNILKKLHSNNSTFLQATFVNHYYKWYVYIAISVDLCVYVTPYSMSR